jgi:hypothetical protein
MGATIRVHLRGGEGIDLRPGFRNLGEDVFREVSGRATVGLDEVDSCVDVFHVRDVRTRNLGKVTQLLKRLIRRHNFVDDIELVRDE